MQIEYFSQSSLFSAYRNFMSTMFKMYAVVGADARLRVPIASKWGDRRTLPWWHESMIVSFDADGSVNIEEFQHAYDLLAEGFREDLYVTDLDQPIMGTRSSPFVLAFDLPHGSIICWKEN